jgi:hypothetical protein
MSQWQLYSKLTHVYWETLQETILVHLSVLFYELRDFKEDLELLTYHMLEARFKPQESTKPKADPLELKGKRPKQKSVALLAYEGKLTPKVKQRPLSPTDIAKFFKGLEVFLLRRQWIFIIEELELGNFFEAAKRIIDRLPKLLLVIEKLPAHIRKPVLDFLFSIIVIYRQFKLKSHPDLETITREYDGDTPISKLLSTTFSDLKVGRWIDTLRIKKEDANSLRLSIYSGNSSSPNSGASATKIIEDAAAVRLDTKLKEAIFGFAKEIPEHHHFIYLVEVLFENIWDLNNTIHSKLFHFTAKGGKARIIANVDWITQTALSAFHFYMYKLLTRIPSDWTFNHKGGLPYVWEARSENDNFYSIDLSAATDRMPRLLQARILKAIGCKLGLNGEALAKHWLNIVDRHYSTKSSGMNNGRSVVYSVGQGMGLFTSWPIMALTHHYIVNGVCGISTDSYSLVGDDLVIRGKSDAFDKYVYVLKQLGLEVNTNKTVKSETKGSHNVEFARNFIIAGVQINPIEYGILYAWNDEKTSFESFLYAMRSTLSSLLIQKLAANFCLNLNTVSLLCIMYFFWKYKLTNNGTISIYDILSPYTVPQWMYSIDFSRIHDAVTLKFGHVRPGENLLEDAGDTPDAFMDNFRSDLVVRTKLDASRARDLAQRIGYLKFVDDHIGKMALQISKRLWNVELIRYDIDEFGNPLVSKGARRLLEEITDHYFLTNPVPKTEPAVWGDLNYV